MGHIILVVDDEPDVIKYLCSFLNNNGFATLEAIDGRQGMEIAEKELPDLISLDITMPNESGTRMLRNLNENPLTRKIPVIIVTGVDARYKEFLSNRKQVQSPVAFFEKPLDKSKYLHEIHKILKR